MEYKEVSTAEKGCPYPLNRTAAVHRIVYCILSNEFSPALQPCQLLSQCLVTSVAMPSLRLCFFVIVVFRDNSPE